MIKSLLLVLIAVLAAPAPAEPLVLVREGKSDHSIYYSEAAPNPVKIAAQEIQRAVEIATGVKLPIVNAPATPMIALGDSDAAKAAGLDGMKMEEEEYRVIVKGRDLFIVGHDTPAGRLAWGAADGHGTSQGTLCGTYDLLEKTLDARWLMPGDVGEDIPKRSEWVFPGETMAGKPAFKMRALYAVRQTGPGTRNGLSEVDIWLRRQRTGGAWHLGAGHAWDEPIDAETLKKHPEWMAVNGDKGKFCTSNKELVKAFSDGVVQIIGKRSGNRFHSISPEDGGGFCTCPKCLALVENDPHGDPSYSVVVLKFYNDVARLVIPKCPDKKLAGIVYYNYMYPPSKPVEVNSNVYLNWAALEYYGMGLYKPKYRDEFTRIAENWRRLTPNLSYSSYSHFFRSTSGAPVPPALEILKLEMPTLKKLGYQTMNQAGAEAWGYGGVLNYLLARLMWDSSQDVDALYREYLARAYGPGWESIARFYQLLDDGFRQNKLKEKEKRNYDVTYAVIADVHVPLLSKLETLYTEALAKAATEPQRKRLTLLGDNMAQLHYNLRRVSLIPSNEKSPFYRPDAEVEKMLADAPNNFALAGAPSQVWTPEKRTLRIPRLAGAVPKLDGDLSDPAWKKAAVADDFRRAGTRNPGIRATTARLFYTDDALLIAFDCAEAKGADVISEGAARDDDKVYHGDVVEVFFCDAPEPQRWWHLSVNPNGVQWDGLNDKPAYDLEWKAAVRKNDKGWTVEMMIPFESLKRAGAPSGEAWRANLAREEAADPREVTSWNGVEEHLAKPDQFGEWLFEP
ncbi:MAG: DUF4838 domain-containing protein [Verrucomicrobia bacterium]|nr:DUF4838 domain-containing protein [Verrucomicrobiota bacterium]